MKVHTQSIHFTADEKLLFYIEQKLSKLTQFFDRIMIAEVKLKLENNTGRIRDKITEIQIKLPGDILYVSTTSKTFEAAVDQALSKLKKQLVRYKGKRRG